MAKNNNKELTPQDAQEAILSPITKALTDNKITLDRIASKFDELIDCKRTYVTKDGIEIDTPDRPTQLKATIESGKLLQAYPAEKLKIESDTDIIINLVQYGQPQKAPKCITEDKA